MKEFLVLGYPEYGCDRGAVVPQYGRDKFWLTSEKVGMERKTWKKENPNRIWVGGCSGFLDPLGSPILSRFFPVAF